MMGAGNTKTISGHITTIGAVFLALFAVNSAMAVPLYTTQELFPLPGDYRVEARSINAAGQVVGYSRSAAGRTSAVLWSGGTVQDLSPEATPNHALVANDINDFGQIVGFGAACGFPCGIPAPLPDIHIPFESGIGPVAWLAQTGGIQLPPLPNCRLDEGAVRVSNAGYTLGTGSLTPPTATGFFHNALCLITVLELYENGVAVTPFGFLYDPIVHFIFDPTLTFPIFQIDGPVWVLAPTCTGDEHAYAFGVGPYPNPFLVSDDVKAVVCALAARGYQRDRQLNAAGQFIENIGDRAFLLTPAVPEPATLALLGLGLAGLGISRRRNKKS